MVASRTFNSILQQIQSSNLNFHLQISPFSANISLKKTLIKDKFGAPLLLPPQPAVQLPAASCFATYADLAALAAKNLQLEKDLAILRKDYENSVNKCEAAHQNIKSLEKISAEKTTNNEVLKNEISEKDVLVSN